VDFFGLQAERKRRLGPESKEGKKKREGKRGKGKGNREEKRQGRSISVC